MLANIKSLAETLYLISFYKSRNQADVAVDLLHDFIKQDALNAPYPEYERSFSLSLYNLAELCSNEGDRLNTTRLYSRAANIWNTIEPRNRSSIGWYGETLDRLRDASINLTTVGAYLLNQEVATSLCR